MATPARARSRRGEGERLRDTLLDAASQLLDRSSDVEQLSVRAVTARAGVSPTAMYLHFADKEELVREVKARCFAALGDVLREAQDAHAPDPRDQLRAMGHAYLRYARDHPGHYAILFHGTAGPGKRRRSAHGAVRSVGLDVFQLLVDAVERCLAGRRDAFEYACLVWTALHGCATLQQTMPWFPLPEEERFLAMIGAGIVGDDE